MLFNIIGTLAIIFSLLFIYNIFYVINLNFLQIKKWPTVDGTITSSTHKGFKYRKKIEDTDTAIPDIKYEYYVEEKKYEGNILSYVLSKNPTFSNVQEAEEFLKDYPVGNNVTVYYNKKKPSVCALNNEYSCSTLSVSIIGSILLPIFGIICLLFL